METQANTGSPMTAIVHHYHQYQRKRRREEPEEGPLSNEADVTIEAQLYGAAVTCDDSGFTTTSICCTRCHTVKPSNDFYQSCLARKAFYCKCCSAKRSKVTRTANQNAQVEIHAQPSTDEQQLPSPAVAATVAPPQRRKSAADIALRLLNQLRRKCHQPSRLLQRVQGRTAEQRCTIAFDVKVTRSLLEFWEHRSAIPHAAASPPSATDTADIAHAPSTTRIMQDDLELLVWGAPSERVIEPWHVIPVTHAQARRLRLVPATLRPCMLSPQAVALIQQRLADLKEMFDVRPDPHTT